ncbi:ran-binding protein 3-like [Halichondria panicea]|uniref:ran-binding protein 3-like n=1 Tax=Halichondria panicea TaxID=6063 RepID=UPI00312B7DDD
MAQIGQKRPSHDIDADTSTDTIANDDLIQASPSKRPAKGLSNFSFRPSPLQSATKGFALRQSSLKAPPIAVAVPTPSKTASAESISEQSIEVEKSTSGFLKMSQESIKLVGVSSVSIMAGEGKPVMTTGGTSIAAIVSHSRSPFLQSETGGFKSTVGSSSENYFSAASQTKSATTPSDNGETPGNQATEEGNSPNTSMFLDSSKSKPLSDKGGDSVEQGVFGGASSRQPILPEVHAFTGEESEKNIVLISAKLYIFEGDTRTWKDRGRGEIRLNDSAKDEGVFQSRLVMRASGTHRVLLNTHLWSQMSCEKANQKNLRITAQHLNSTEDIGVYLITGAAKDIQTLFTAIDRRIQALKRNVLSDNTEQATDPLEPSNTTTILPDDEEDKDESISRQSSPDSSPEAIRVRAIERPPVISVSNVDRAQRSRSSEPSTDEGGSKSPPPDDEDKATPTSAPITR